MNPPLNDRTKDDARYTLGLAACGMHMAQYLFNEESNSERKEKKGRIISKKRKLFVSAIESYAKEYGELDSKPTHTEDVTIWICGWKLDDRLTLLIDTLFSNPFLPYDVDYKEKDFKAAWGKLARTIGVGPETLQQIEANASDARKSHRHINWLKIGLIGGGAAALSAVGGWVLAPWAGGILGSAAGLSGAAATSYGLALLGGGSLAAGGAGMAGGMWLVTTTAALTAGSLGTISQIAYQLGAQQFQTEVIKLQVNLKTLVAQNQISLAALQEKITGLRKQREDLASHLKEEKALNDSNSQRLKDLESKIQAVTDAIGWLEKEAA
jgi:hypothetical protein